MVASTSSSPAFNEAIFEGMKPEEQEESKKFVRKGERISNRRKGLEFRRKNPLRSEDKKALQEEDLVSREQHNKS